MGCTHKEASKGARPKPSVHLPFPKGTSICFPPQHHCCDYYPYCPSLTHATSPCLLFSLLLGPHLLSHRCSCHCLESAMCVEKKNKIRPLSYRRNDTGRSMPLLWPEIFPCHLHSCRRRFSQPQGLKNMVCRCPCTDLWCLPPLDQEGNLCGWPAAMCCGSLKPAGLHVQQQQSRARWCCLGKQTWSSSAVSAE